MHKTKEDSYFYRIFRSMFLICLVFVLIMSFVTASVFYGLYKIGLRESSQITAERVKAAIENMAKGYEEMLLELDADEEIRSFVEGNTNNISSLIWKLYVLRNSFTEKASISVLCLANRQWASTSRQVIADTNAEFTNWGIFRKANLTEGVAIYAMARDSLLNPEDRLCMAKACRDKAGNVLGYILVEIPRSTFETITIEYAGQYSTGIVIVNKSASVIYHSEGESLEGLGEGEKYGYDRDFGAAQGVTSQNYAFSQSDFLKLTVLQEIPSGTLSVIMKPLLFAIGSGVLLITLLAFFYSRRLAKSICDPIKEMIETMQVIKEGNLSVRLNFDRTDEIGQLGKAFDSMTERVEELMERMEEEKHSLWVAEMRSLSLQMNPHFLYNTLDLIKWNAKLGKNDEIVSITVLLGKVLRRVMNTKSDLVTVAYELEIVDAFVKIQKKHYGERLSVSVDVESDLWDLYIPKLVIQPIVENAIVHGFSDRAESCRIRIIGKYKNPREGLLEFQIEDDGIGMSETELTHILEFRQEGLHHIGLNNVQRRAKLFGNESCGITVKSRPEEGTSVTLILKAVKKSS